MTTTTFKVTGMTCGHCEASVREEVAEVDGVDSVEVSAATGTLEVSAGRFVEADAVIAAVAEAGYQAVRIS